MGKSTQFNNKSADKIGPTNENFKSLLLGLLKCYETSNYFIFQIALTFVFG